MRPIAVTPLNYYEEERTQGDDTILETVLSMPINSSPYVNVDQKSENVWTGKIQKWRCSLSA
jgi:hypothetical protein